MDLALAIDIGGTKFSVGLVTRNGELIDRVNVPVDRGGSGEELFEDLAETMEISVDIFVQYLANVQIGSLQLIQGRGYNYQVNGLQAASLTFHSAPTLKKAAIPSINDKKQGTEHKTLGKTFKVGDRVAVNANRQQYANHKGVVEQVISVSCRVKLDNGWTAFLPNHCLDHIT